MNDNYDSIAQALYDHFVINPTAVAVQRENGSYISVKTPITKDMIKNMLLGGFSLGIYQQQLFNDKLKWICFDFDTTKKENNEEEVNKLKEMFVIPFVEKLDKKEISYYVEFSGRRGFHVWVFFDQIISKDLAYTITNYLISDIYEELKNYSEFGLDLFPKTKSGKIPNKYGLQVKLPLSRHKVSKTYSYFIEDVKDFKVKRVFALDDEIISNQLEIIQRIKENNVVDLLNKIGLETKISKEELIDYHTQFVNLDKKIKLEDIKNVFCSDEALGLVWNHICSGTIDSLERMILLGIFGHMSCGEALLNEIFKLQNNYNKLITQKMVNRYRDTMFPITFKYLYQYMHLKDCSADKEKVYIDDYVVEYLGFKCEKFSINKIEKQVNFVKTIVDKEINYFYYNDEVYDFNILNQMKLFTFYDFSNIEKYINNVEKGEVQCPKEIVLKKYIRQEENKERVLVSLGAKERVITTALINKLILYCQKDYKSYSYHLNLGLEGDVFYPWISSWTRFKNDISQYFSVPFFEQYYCIKIDFRHFYDSIFLHSAFDNIMNTENIIEKDKFKNIYSYLFQFNELIMKKLCNTIQGVPQGPAYARVLAEITIDELIEQFLNENEKYRCINLYRYVDDMFVFGDKESLMDSFINDFAPFFEARSLFLNKTKTKKYGKIKDLLPQDKSELKEFRDFNYDMFQLKDQTWGDDFEKELFDTKYLRFIYRRKEWNINDANLIFSNKIDDSVKKRYLHEYYYNILKSEIGRGSLYRKFYEYILSEDERARGFIENEEYRKTPVDSINRQNLICCMILYAEKINFLINDSSKKTLVSFLNQIQDDNAFFLQKLLRYGEDDELQC